jgi:hypothetical protein
LGLRRQIREVRNLPNRYAGGGDRTRTTLGESRDFKNDQRIEKGPEKRVFPALSAFISWLWCVADRPVSFRIATATVTGTRSEISEARSGGRLHRPRPEVRSRDQIPNPTAAAASGH